MVFGSKKRKPAQDADADEHSDSEEGNGAEDSGFQADANANRDGSADHDQDEDSREGTGTGNPSLPLLAEVTVISSPSKSGGTKKWVCKHCGSSYTSSYTRIHQHFFGPNPGKKPDIARCSAMKKDTQLLGELRMRVEEAEKKGVATNLKNSLLTDVKSNSCARPLNPIAEAFNMMERDEVDLDIMLALAANGIPFNVLRNPQFCQMVSSINRAPKGYKAPSYEKARTTLLDACKSRVEKNLAPIKETWYTHGVSIVSDGWTNVKNMPLINVIASNCRGSMFLYAEDFSGVEKTGEAIAEFLLSAI